MNLPDIELPSRDDVLKFERLISASGWDESDKNALIGLLRSLDAARTMLVDGEIAKENLKAIIARASDSKRAAQMKALFEDGIIDLTATPDVAEAEPSSGTATSASSSVANDMAKSKSPRKGHGRRPLLHLAAATEHHDAVSDRIGTPCPQCASSLCRGHQRQTTVVVANTILSVNLHVREALECKTCGLEEVTPLPEVVSRGLIGRYAPSAVAMLAFLRYFSGFASHRFETASCYFGLEVSETTQWDLFEEGANRLAPLHRYLCSLVGNAHLITMDHTGAKVVAEQRHRRLLEGDDAERVGMTTSAFLVELAERAHSFAIYRTGPTDAGQHLKKLLENRPPGTGPLLVACDALASNQNQDHPDIKIALCNVHARRAILELGSHAPKAAAEILLQYDIIFQAERRAAGLEPEARLAIRQSVAEPAMRRIRDLALVEMLSETRLPTGRIAEPFVYLLRHFDRLLTFCRFARAPLHTNDVERALKKPILHRKNSLFFQTFAGSGVADVFTSLFFSAKLAGHNPIAFVREALDDWRSVARTPETFVPWLVPQLK